MGTESMHVISYVKGDSKQRVMEQVGNLFGANYLDVVAEDGSRNRYTIYFDMLRSSDATLLDLILDGVSINGFDANQTHYTYTLLPNSSSIPVLDYVKQNSRQNVELVLPVCEGVATLRVVAEDGVSEKTYEIEFAFAPFSNSALQGITLNGSVMSDFDADVLSYTIDVAANDLCPSVGYITADSTQHIAMATAGCEGSEIIVVAQDGSSRKYEVRFNHLLGTVSTLNGIELFHNGQWFTLPAFDAEVTDYSCELSWRSTTVPVINPIAAQKGQQITIAYGHINEPSVVTVRSEDGMSVSTYRINFPVEKSGVSTLSGINIGGSSLLGFDANTFEYLITLPYQTTMLPSISWEYAVDSTGETIDEQRVELTQRSLHEETTLRVIAEDGTESIYSIRFAVAKSDNENVLSMILVDGNPLPNFDGQTNHYNIVLPRGTTQVPAISYVKSYPEQVVMSNIGTSNSATILTVYSDKAGEQPVEYRIDMSISGVTDSYLTGIYVDGVLVPNFATDKTSYVVGVINTPVVTYTTADGIQVEEMISTSKHVRLNAFSLTNSDETHYDIYFYYVNDIIPNADFESWETATYNNANRPTGWTVPADVAEKYVFTGFGSGLISAANKTYLTGKEVNQVVGDGNSVVKLHTWSQEFSIHGGLPGMMTLGDMSISFGSGGSTSSSVSGGIQFRNTPDEAHMDYMQSSSRNRVNNMRFVYQLTDGTVSEELVFTDASFDDTWKHMQFPLSGSVTAPTQMNIIVNAILPKSNDGAQRSQPIMME